MEINPEGSMIGNEAKLEEEGVVAKMASVNPSAEMQRDMVEGAIHSEATPTQVETDVVQEAIEMKVAESSAEGVESTLAVDDEIVIEEASETVGKESEIGAAESGSARLGDELVSTEAGGRRLGGWGTMPYILGSATLEKVASFGLTANLIIYLVKEYHLNWATAVTFVQIWNGISNFAPLLGAYVADVHWGMFKTMLLASIANVLGMMVMLFTQVVEGLQPPSCEDHLMTCEPSSYFQLTILVLALVLVGLGGAGIRPCSIPFGLDQFEQTTESGRKSRSSYLNWYHTTNSLGVVIASTFIVYLEHNISWALGFGICSLLMFLSTIIYFIGRRRYIHISPKFNVFTDIAHVFVAAYRKRSLNLPPPHEQHNSLYNHNPLDSHAEITAPLSLTQEFKILNKAAIVLQRMAIGLILSTLSMVVAGVVERERKHKQSLEVLAWQIISVLSLWTEFISTHRALTGWMVISMG